MTEKTTTVDSAALEPLSSGMAGEHALLGLLALNDGGLGHGYDLAKQFESNAPLGSVIRLEPGMVYHFLKKLERLGWLTALPETQGRPARRLVALSEVGRAELDRWLAEPVAHTREIRLDFLVKLYFALLLNPVLAVRLVGEQREMCAQLVQSLTARLRSQGEGKTSSAREHRFGDMVIDMRLAQTQAALAWLDRVEHDAQAAVDGVSPQTARS